MCDVCYGNLAGFEISARLLAKCWQNLQLLSGKKADRVTFFSKLRFTVSKFKFQIGMYIHNLW